MTKRFPRWFLLPAILLATACDQDRSTEPTANDNPLPPPPPDATRPSDPGLTFDLACLASLPMDLDLKAGSRPLSGIPAVTDPDFVRADQVSYLVDGDLVFGVEVAGRFLAFPARILNYHEVTTYTMDRYRYAATW